MKKLLIFPPFATLLLAQNRKRVKSDGTWVNKV
jgi:hypothetical protein